MHLMVLSMALNTNGAIESGDDRQLDENYGERPLMVNIKRAQKSRTCHPLGFHCPFGLLTLANQEIFLTLKDGSLKSDSVRCPKLGMRGGAAPRKMYHEFYQVIGVNVLEYITQHCFFFFFFFF
jgi:hypothetical protein